VVFPRVLIELAPSGIDGVGVFAVSPLRKDQRVAEGISESDYERLVPWKYLDELNSDIQEKIKAFCIGTPNGFIPPVKYDFNRLSIEWYMNHSCNGNIGFDKDGDFVARRDIAKGEELTYDYALAESNPSFRMKCRCDSSNCRSIITGDDWKDPQFQVRNAAYMLPRLRNRLPLRAALIG
jgi:uncharacterized protein